MDNIYDKYKGRITCAYKKDIIIDEEGNARVTAQRTKHREEYILYELNEEVVLIECPKDVLAIEFEGERSINEEILNQVEKNVRKHSLDYCIVDHGGTSPYLYLFNLLDLPEGYEHEAKKFLALKLVPEKYHSLLDVTNLGKTLIPLINRPHWKPKYYGAIHKIIHGKEPLSHYNPLKRLLLDFSKPKLKKGESDDECDEIKKKVYLSSLLSHYGMDISINPAKCLWHDSKGAKCFSFNDNLGIWHCFHCGKSGNIFHFVMENERCNFPQAKKLIANFGGIILKERKKKIENHIGTELGKAVNSFTNFIDMAEQFVKAQPLYYDNSNIWWFWNFNEFKWEIFDEIDLMNLIDEKVNITGTVHSNVKSPILEALKRTCRKHEPMKSKSSWIQFKDRIVDIETNEVKEAIAEYHVTNPIPWEIGGSEETPHIDKLFKEWVEEKYLPTLYEIMAFSIVPNYFIHRIFCLTGRGSNGKSTFLNLLRKFVGENNVTSVELDLLIENRFESSKLYKKLVCVMGETNFNAIKKTSLLKRLSGQDLIGYEFKNKNPFDDENYAKILIATNTLPVTFDKTDGFYRRWCIVDFPNSFPKEMDILKDIPDVEFRNLSRRCIIILKDLWKKREFANEGDIENRRKRYEEKSNPLGMFIKENCEIGVNEEMPFFIFYEDYITWLDERGYRKISKKELSNQLDNEGYETENRNQRTQNGYTTWKFINGLKLKSYKKVEFGGIIYH